MFARPLYLLFLINVLAVKELNIVRRKQSMILHLSLQFFRFKKNLDAGLDCGQYPFQPIKFVNLVVPSPCETEPYNKWFIKLNES